MSTLHELVTSRAALEDAWGELLARQSVEGKFSVAVAQFAESASERLHALAGQLRDGTYRPHDFHEVQIPKHDSSFRVLAVPSIQDTIVELAVLKGITGYVDRCLGVASYADRPGLSVADAVQAVVTLREEGLAWVLQAKVWDCLGTIAYALVRRMLVQILPDSSLDAVIVALLSRRVHTRDGLSEVSVPSKEAALFPLLRNLVLTNLDNKLLDNGFPVVRFSDDFTVVCSSQSEAWEALRIATQALEELGMNLDEDKTEVMSFSEGFCFLGEDFGTRYPPLISLGRVDDSVQRVLYAGRQGSRIATTRGKVTVESKDEELLLEVPASHISRVVTFGSVSVSSGLRAWAFDSDVEMVFLSRRGSYQGQFISGSSPQRLARLRTQLALEDNVQHQILLASAMVEAKIGHQISLVQRFGRREHAEDIRAGLVQMRGLQGHIRQATSVPELMGCEGAAAKTYFTAFGLLLPLWCEFSGRSRRPPLDVVNAALSYGYAILLGECVSALFSAGLDPSIGILHSDSDRRPSLALDLMEEFRPMVVDQVVLSLARKGALTAEHGYHGDGESGVWLTKEGKRVLTQGYEHRMLQMTGGALPDFSGSLRRHVYRQAQRLAATVADPECRWTGLAWR
ncbi:MAG: CRISPR-associated endonuclease Cas1 [Mycobacteriaceae bacterium]